MKEIKLYGKYGKDKYTIVSDVDFESLNKFRWYLSKDYKTDGLYYVVRYERNGKYLNYADRIFIHRQILGDKHRKYVDHINRNTLDNTRENLRHLCPSKSNKNRNFNNYGWGVGYTKVNNKYIAQALGNYLGRYKTAKEARAAYLNYILLNRS